MNSSMKKYECNQCDKSFKSNQSLKQHHDYIHEGVSRIKFECNQCDKSYNTKDALIRHQDYIHEGLRKYECQLCDKSYADATPLRNHMKTIHAEKGSFKCQKCDKCFTTMVYLKFHIRYVHVLTESAECNYCGKNVPKKNMTKHLKHHLSLDQGKYVCELGEKKCPFSTYIMPTSPNHIKHVNDAIFSPSQNDITLVDMKGY